MGKLDLNFEPGDLAGLVWVAIAVLGVAETVRYLRAGRPGSAGARAGLVGLAAVLLGSLILSGRLNVRHISHGWACFILALLVLPWMVRSYATTTRPIHPLTRLTLRSLRIAAALVQRVYERLCHVDERHVVSAL